MEQVINIWKGIASHPYKGIFYDDLTHNDPWDRTQAVWNEWLIRCGGKIVKNRLTNERNVINIKKNKTI